MARSEGSHRPSLPTLILAGAGALALLGALLLAQAGSFRDFLPNGLTTANRTLNQTMAVVMTSIALVIPLTANLYTPRLVRLYVTHPLIVGGLSAFFLSELVILSLHFYPPDHPFSRLAARVVVVLYVGIMLGALPYFYGLSQFLRPAFFLPMLTRRVIQGFEALRRGRKVQKVGREAFETVDVMTNIALTGLARGDRQLVLQALGGLHALLLELIGEPVGCAGWRATQAWFVPGLAREGQAFLVRERVWPEAYLLGQALKVTEAATRRQQEVLSEQADHLVVSAGLAAAREQARVVELHVMAFNTLLRESVEAQDLRRFQNLSYYMRLLAEALHRDPVRMLATTGHLIHYARIGARLGVPHVLETVTYDLGELALSLGGLDEERSVEMIQAWAGPLWQEGMAPASPLGKAAWRTVLRVYWEAKAAGLREVADAVYWRFLRDDAIHREHLEVLLEENQELHYEFNDRLLRFAYLSPKAVALAEAFEVAW